MGGCFSEIQKNEKNDSRYLVEEEACKIWSCYDHWKLVKNREEKPEEEGEDTSSGPKNGHFQDIIKSDLIGILTCGFLQRVLQTVIFAHTKFGNASMIGSIFKKYLKYGYSVTLIYTTRSAASCLSFLRGGNRCRGCWIDTIAHFLLKYHYRQHKAE